jgi:HPt (histidine-containing phosphotransfer) domain-containing protein
MAQTRQNSLDRLSSIQVRLEALNRQRAEAVADARRADHSWAEIASVLGVTKQSAWALFADQIEMIEKNRENAHLSEDEAIALAVEATRSVRRSRRVDVAKR